jgi:hypothetical protein
VPLEGLQGPVVEGVRHETLVLDDGELLAVGDGHARRFLPAVLKGVEGQVGEVGDGLARSEDTDDAARLLGALEVALEGAMRRHAGEATGAPRCARDPSRAPPLGSLVNDWF